MSDDVPSFDARARRLCPDGACVGLIGPDGHCRVCGEADPDARNGLGPEAFAGGCAQDQEDDGIDDGADSDAASHAPIVEGGFDPNRRLCPDGACLGVVGPGGACNVCGQRATS